MLELRVFICGSSFALLWVWSGILRSSCWMSRRQEWIPSLSSGCGETRRNVEELPTLETWWNSQFVFLQEGHACCIQEPSARSHPHHTLHGGGRGCVRPRRHHGFWPAEVLPSLEIFFFLLLFILLNKSDLYGIASSCILTVSLPSDASAPSSTWRQNTDKATVWRWNWERSWQDSSRWRCCTRRSSESFLTPSDRRGALKGLAAESRKINDSLYRFCLFSLIVL